MECLQNRIDSFAKPKRVRNPAKQSSVVSVKWLHPSHPPFIATPESLAEAGFYFNPSFEDRDNVACFVCDKQLADWEADDDPFDIHWAKCGDKCCWAIVRCGLQGDINRYGGFISTDKSRAPTSKAMERARRETFFAGDGWIHDQVKNHGANSRKMACAGFIFTPQHTGDDTATCVYCDVILSGWEASDDPMEEHRKRRNGSCPMFDAGESATKLPSRTPSAKALSKSRTPRHIRAASPSNDTDFIEPLKTHDSDANEPYPAPSSKRIRTLSSSSKSAKTPKVLRSQSRSELKDVVEDEETEAEMPRIGRGKAKKSMSAAIKKVKSRSKSVARRIISDDEEEVMSKAPSRSRSKAKGKEKAAFDDDEPEEEIKKLKKSTRGRPPSRLKESEEHEHEVKVLKKSTRGRAPPRVEESENQEEEEEQDVKTVKKITKSRVPPRVKEPESDDENITKTVKKPTRTKTPSHVEGKTTARKPSKSRKITEPEPDPDPDPESDPQPDAETEVADEEERKPRASFKSRAKTPASRRPSRARPKAPPVPAEEEQEEEMEESPPSPLPVVEKKRAPSTTARTSRVAKPDPTLANRAPSASSSVPNQPKTLESKVKGKLPAPGPPLPEEQAVDNDDDEMDVFVSPRESPGSHAEEEEVPDRNEKASEIDAEMEPLVIPKRAKPSTLKPSTKPAKAMDEDIDMESEPASKEPLEVKPQVPGKETNTKPTRNSQSEIKGRKGSFLKVVEISTDEEGGASDEEQQPQKDKSELSQTTVLPPTGAPPSLELKELAEKPTTVVEPPALHPVEPAPSRKATPPPPSTPPVPTKPPVDIEMAAPEIEPKPFVEPQPESVVEAPVPQTPPRVVAPPKPPTPEPPLFLPPLSKLPSKPLQSLSDAELDMTVEEWIRYQMEMEYDKFKRDGEREIGRFKKRADEVKDIIDRL